LTAQKRPGPLLRVFHHQVTKAQQSIAQRGISERHPAQNRPGRF
jgi:hypothetical protein